MSKMAFTTGTGCGVAAPCNRKARGRSALGPKSDILDGPSFWPVYKFLKKGNWADGSIPISGHALAITEQNAGTVNPARAVVLEPSFKGKNGHPMGQCRYSKLSPDYSKLS